MDHAIQQLDTEDPQALEAAYGIFAVLRPHLSKTQFMDQVRAQTAEGYRIVVIEQDAEIVAAAGYRVATFLAWGRALYIDELIAHPQGKNKPGVTAEFHPPTERLAFPTISDGEADLPEIWAESITPVLDVLLSKKTYREVADNLPDIQLAATNRTMHATSA